MIIIFEHSAFFRSGRFIPIPCGTDPSDAEVCMYHYLFGVLGGERMTPETASSALTARNLGSGPVDVAEPAALHHVHVGRW